MADQARIDQKNADFWNELCGTSLARSLGVVDSSAESLKIFDDWYMAFYPYLTTHIPFHNMAGKDVLEVGLGYGTVSQKIAASGARYSGLDIAAGPVAMANERIRREGHEPTARQGSVLNAPFDDNKFSYVVAIGCLHHTGDLQRAIDECRRILKPGGQLVFMVYYAYSYRRFRQVPAETISYSLRETLGYRGPVFGHRHAERAAYDTIQSGEAAPHTDFISKRSLRHLCRDFTSFKATTENIDQEKPFSKRSRNELLKTRWPSIVGLDLYAIAEK